MNTQRKSVSLAGLSASPERVPSPQPVVPVSVKRARPTSRAEAEAAARQEGAKRVEHQQAQQRAEKGAAAVLEQGLQVAVSVRHEMLRADARISCTHRSGLSVWSPS